MKICQFDNNRIGVVLGERVYDVTETLRPELVLDFPPPVEDALIAHLDELRSVIAARLAEYPTLSLHDVRLRSPVARPPKIVAAPVNYRKHVDESKLDPGIHHGSAVKDILTAGLFLKSPTSLVGPGNGINIRFGDRRNDHEIELVVVIGRKAERICRETALDHVAGYCIGLDMTVRGPEDRSFRKSPDTYTVLGPWLVTADEFGAPDEAGLTLTVNGEVRQKANTRDLLIDVPGLIELASRWYTLYPGDVLFTGTPEGVGPVVAGDVLEATIDRIGTMRVQVN